MQDHEFIDISYELDADGIVTVQMNTPKRKNAISGLTALELRWAAERFRDDKQALAMILTGAPDPGSPPEKQAFSSGGYFVPGVYDGLPEELVAQIDNKDIAMKSTVMTFLGVDKPVLVAMNGLAIGGGITLPLAVGDQVYVSEHAWARFPFASLGIAAELGSTCLLPRLLGLQKTKQLLFYPDKLDANTLAELGIANAVLPHDELLAYTREQALKLVPPRGAGSSIRAMKSLLHASLIDEIEAALNRENEALNRLMAEPDFAEALTARMERREPVFSGR